VFICLICSAAVMRDISVVCLCRWYAVQEEKRTAAKGKCF